MCSDEIREKGNKQEYAAAVQRHLYLRPDGGRNVYYRTRHNAARPGHEGSYHESRLIAVKILNHAISMISFPRDRYRDMVKHRRARCASQLKEFPTLSHELTELRLIDG